MFAHPWIKTAVVWREQLIESEVYELSDIIKLRGNKSGGGREEGEVEGQDKGSAYKVHCLMNMLLTWALKK